MILRREKVSRREFFRPMTLPWWIATALFIASLLLVRYFNQTEGAQISLCPTKNLFRIPCPLCRGTSATFQLVEGNVSGALQSNPLATLLVVGATCWVTLWLVFGIRLRATIPTKVTAALILLALAANWSYLLAIR